MEYQIGAHGILATPDLHDGRLWAVQVSDDKSAQVVCSSISGKKYKLEFSQVRAFAGMDLRQGNTIHIIWVFQKLEIPPAEIESLLFGKDWADRNAVDRMVHEVQSGDCLFVHIEPNYGCRIKVLCAGFAISDLTEAKET